MSEQDLKDEIEKFFADKPELVKQLSDGWYEITAGNLVMHVKEEGLKQFYDALKKEVTKPNKQ